MDRTGYSALKERAVPYLDIYDSLGNRPVRIPNTIPFKQKGKHSKDYIEAVCIFARTLIGNGTYSKLVQAKAAVRAALAEANVALHHAGFEKKRNG